MRPSDDELFVILARHAAGEGAAVEQARTTPLPGGFVSKSVDRLDLTLSAPGGPAFLASFVRKTCPAREVRALELLGDLDGAAARPAVVASWAATDRPRDPDASGFVSPFYPGGGLHAGDPIPEPVLVTLARLHARHADAAAYDWTWAFAAPHVDLLAERALAAADGSERFRAETPDHADWRARLARASASPTLRELADSLPRALAHGDMHPANIVLAADGAPVIIDWGGVCRAPPMLDIANIVEIDSPAWATYSAAYRAAGGQADEETSRRAYTWARAMTAILYIPWAADNSARVPSLIAQLEEANGALG